MTCIQYVNITFSEGLRLLSLVSRTDDLDNSVTPYRTYVMGEVVHLPSWVTRLGHPFGLGSSPFPRSAVEAFWIAKRRTMVAYDPLVSGSSEQRSLLRATTAAALSRPPYRRPRHRRTRPSIARYGTTTRPTARRL